MGTEPVDGPAELAAGDFTAVLFGAPHGTPYPGVDNEPHAATAQALRDALGFEADWVEHWSYDVGGTIAGPHGRRFGDLGDLPTTSLDGAGNRALIEEATRAIVAARAIPIMIGGDDSTPIPFLAGLADAGPLTILQIDAHIDWRDQRRGEPLGFSSTMRRASEMPHVERIVQVGMRTFGSARAEEVGIAADWGATIVPARDVHHRGIGPVLDLIPAGSRVAITIDCDAFDASLMPAVIAPSPGGLDYTQVTDLIGGVLAKAELAAFDLIEFAPAKDVDGSSTLTAAYLLQFVLVSLANAQPR
jgi:agmatinase